MDEPGRAVSHVTVVGVASTPHGVWALLSPKIHSRKEDDGMLWLILGIILLAIAIAGGALIHPVIFVLGVLALFLAGRRRGGRASRAPRGAPPPSRSPPAGPPPDLKNARRVRGPLP